MFPSKVRITRLSAVALIALVFASYTLLMTSDIFKETTTHSQRGSNTGKTWSDDADTLTTDGGLQSTSSDEVEMEAKPFIDLLTPDPETNPGAESLARDQSISVPETDVPVVYTDIGNKSSGMLIESGVEALANDTLSFSPVRADKDETTMHVGVMSADFKRVTNQHVPYSPNPRVILESPDPSNGKESPSPTKSALPPLEEYKDRFLPPQYAQEVMERELAEPETILADDTHERSARLPKGYPSVDDPDYEQLCGQFHGSEKTSFDMYEFSDTDDLTLNDTRTSSEHAMVILMSGDAAARMGMALVQSLRNAKTCPGIDIVVAMAAGGVGSEDCLKNKNHTKQDCQSLSPVALSDIVSLPYLKALAQLGVRFRLLPRFESRTAKIPGGRQTFWGMSFNKLGLFNWTEYKKLMVLDADELFFRNVDYLLFYPMFTGAMTQCCTGVEVMKPSGGLWIIEPSRKLYDLVRVFTNEYDPSRDDGYDVDLPDWHFSDMDVVLMMFGKRRKVKPHKPWPLRFPESADSRQNFAAIRQLWTGKRRDSRDWPPMDHTLQLAGPDDLTTMPLDVKEEYWFRSSTHNRNYFDDIADRMQWPEERGRTWHALNESFDWVAQQCACLPKHDRGPDWFISVHLTCLPVHKPASFNNLPEFRYALAGNEPKIPECLKYYLNLWVTLYEQAMGDLKTEIWWQEDDPAATYKSA